MASKPVPMNHPELRGRVEVPKKVPKAPPRNLPENVVRSKALRNHRNRHMLKD